MFGREVAAAAFPTSLEFLTRPEETPPPVIARQLVTTQFASSELVEELQSNGMKLPDRLEDWDAFKIDQAFAASNRNKLEKRVRDLNFYLRHGYGPGRSSMPRMLLKRASRFRVARNWYGAPIERYVSEVWNGFFR